MIHIIDFIICFFFVLAAAIISSVFWKYQSSKMSGNEKMLRLMTENMSDVIVLVSKNGKLKFATKSMERLLGYTESDFYNLTRELVAEEDQTRLASWFNRIIETKSEQKIEYNYQHRDGYFVSFETVGRPIFSQNGEVKDIVMVARDISQRKETERELKNSGDRYRSLIEVSPDSIIVHQEGKIVYANPAAVKALAANHESQIINKDLLDFVHSDCKDLVTNRVLQNGKTKFNEYRIVALDGKRKDVNIAAVRIIYNDQPAVMAVCRDMSEQIKNQEMVKYMAYHDSLTGLPNRSFLDKHLQQEISSSKTLGQRIAVLFIDLDRFKIINDSLGHAIGDLLLKEVSTRILSSLNAKDMVFRQGGDEFIVILNNANKHTAANRVERILAALSEPCTINQVDIYTSPSIGISIYPEDGETGDLLIKHADFAMYQAKKAGKNTYKFYSFNGQHINPLDIGMDLYKAIERHEFILHYQPKVSLKTGKINGVEALIRWVHPKYGMIHPADFITLAEETGIIVEIGRWTLLEACSQNKKWHDKGFNDLIVSVNLSPRQFSQTDLIDSIKEILAETGLEARFLELEITESMVVDIDKAIQTLQELKDLGVLISIDDFGTGFSSLNYLKDFPVDTLKIDQSFIREIRYNFSNETIVKTIFSMAHHLHLNVVAEGIETVTQMIFLQEHLCDEAQGYFLSKPLQADELEGKLATIQTLVKEFGISEEQKERIWMEESIQKARNELVETVKRHQGLMMKYKKINGRFIHTLCDGELLYRFGLNPKQVIGKELSDFLPKEIADRQSYYYEKAWNGEKQINYEEVFNGFIYLAALSPVKRGGEVVEVIGSFIDITKLKETELALHESQQMYQLIADNMTDLIVIYDCTGTITYVSPSHQTILGHSPGEYIGKQTFTAVHPDDRQKQTLVFLNMVRKKEPFQLELRMSTSSGEWKLFESMFTPILKDDGSVQQIIGVSRDITEKRKSEELLRKSEKLSVAGELAAGVAHEIRNPLTSIKGFFQLFQQGQIKQEYFDVIFSEFNRIEDIINEFLNLAKPARMETQAVNVEILLKEVLILLDSEAFLQNVQFIQEYSVGIPEIAADPGQLKQVIINILKNSIEAIPHINGKIKIKLLLEDENLLIKIIDNGTGISAERLKRLGEPFYSNKEKGTGLGLMLCYRIVREHRGSIKFKSKENFGTVAEIRLPLPS